MKIFKNTKNKKQTVIISALIIACCIALCVGATFAFFTNAVTSQNNKVQAGRLKVDLELVDRNDSTQSISIKTSQAPIFDYTLWEPGYTDVKVLKVENEGDLAIKWQAQYFSQREMTTIANEIDVYVIKSTQPIAYPQQRTDLATWGTPVTLTEFVNNISTHLCGELKAGESAYFGIALQLRTTAGNEYQGQVFGEFDIKILATQQTEEFDAFDDQYDKDACLHTETRMVMKSANIEEKDVGYKRTICKNPKCQAVVSDEPFYLKIVPSATGAPTYVVAGILEGYTDTNIVIPSHFANSRGQLLPIVQVGGFSGNTDITSVTIPSTVTSITNNAFKGCTALQEVTIPNSVTNIGEGAFAGCKQLTSLCIPNGVKEIKRDTFSGCSSLTSVEIPEGVTTIGIQAFTSCTSLTSIEIPNTVKGIRNYAFAHCNALTSVTIPESVTWTGHSLFWDCQNLTSAKILGNCTGMSVFMSCTRLESVEFGPNVTSIADSMFLNCTALKNVTISNGLTSIGPSVFYGCTSLMNIVIPESVESIGGRAFQSSGLTSIYIPDNVASVEAEAFKTCSALESVEFGKNSQLTTIANSTFWGCSSLKSVIIPNKVESIGGQAFYNCSNLGSVTIPASVQIIGGQAFYGCLKIKLILETTNGWYIVRNTGAELIPEATLADPQKASLFYNEGQNELLGWTRTPPQQQE